MSGDAVGYPRASSSLRRPHASAAGLKAPLALSRREQVAGLAPRRVHPARQLAGNPERRLVCPEPQTQKAQIRPVNPPTSGSTPAGGVSKQTLCHLAPTGHRTRPYNTQLTTMPGLTATRPAPAAPAPVVSRAGNFPVLPTTAPPSPCGRKPQISSFQGTTASWKKPTTPLGRARRACPAGLLARQPPIPR